MARVSMTVNGVRYDQDVEPRLLLVHFIRDSLGLTGTHVGCDTSNCGACTVLLDGQAVKSCTLLAAQVDGAELLTIEGMEQNGQLHPLQEGFWQEHGLQCGFCTPGMILAAKALLDASPDPSEAETVVSQLTRTLVGTGTPVHWLVQISTALLLVLAANTAFADFPRLGSILARDRFLPRVFQFRGDRLAFSSGIVLLTLISALLIVWFSGSVTELIPLYTIGVFVAFTLSQAGMVRHWYARRTERGWRRRALINGFGAVTTGIVAIEVGIAKFSLGAWMVLVLIPLLIALMWAIAQHYREIGDALTLERADTPLPRLAVPHIVVPIARIDRAALAALSYARSISADVTALHIADDQLDAERMRRRWAKREDGIPLVTIESPYRALIPPLLAYLDERERQDPDRPITVVLAEFVPRRFWDYLLHNQTALRLKLRLFFRPNTVVVDVPYHL